MSAAINFRFAEPADEAYLVTTFTKSFREVSAFAEGAPAKVLGSLLASLLSTWLTEVAHDPDDPTTILAWICYSVAGVAWVFVRPELRRHGLGTLLLQRACPRSVEVTPFAPTRRDVRDWLHSRGVVELRFRPWLVTPPATTWIHDASGRTTASDTTADSPGTTSDRPVASRPLK